MQIMEFILAIKNTRKYLLLIMIIKNKIKQEK